jgi:hypothetical protein
LLLEQAASAKSRLKLNAVVNRSTDATAQVLLSVVERR